MEHGQSHPPQIRLSIQTYMALCSGSAICHERVHRSARTRTARCMVSVIRPELDRPSPQTRNAWQTVLFRAGGQSRWADELSDPGQMALLEHRIVQVRTDGWSGLGWMALHRKAWRTDGTALSTMSCTFWWMNGLVLGGRDCSHIMPCWFGQTDYPVRG